MKSRAIALSLVALFLLAAGAIAQQASDSRVPDAAQFVGQPAGKPLTGDDLQRETHRVGGLLRCPVCQGLSVADSPAAMAVNMKEQVRELLSRGYTEKQILAYFERSYGQFVLLEPKFEGVTTLVWLLPIVGLLLGGAVLFIKMKNLGKQPVAAPAEVAVPDAVDAPEDPYIARVRELVSGGK
jgi:cytochrome c-type biogenesis protein CcmH